MSNTKSKDAIALLDFKQAGYEPVPAKQMEMIDTVEISRSGVIVFAMNRIVGDVRENDRYEMAYPLASYSLRNTASGCALRVRRRNHGYQAPRAARVANPKKQDAPVMFDLGDNEIVSTYIKEQGTRYEVWVSLHKKDIQ